MSQRAGPVPRGTDAVEVELVEDGQDTHGDDAGAGPVPPDTPAARVPARSRRLRWAVVAAAVAAVAAVNGVQVHQQSVRTAELAAVPGVLARLDAPPVEVWSAPRAWVNDAAGGVVLATAPDGAVQALDAGTGSVLWSADPGTGVEARSHCTVVRPDGPAHPFQRGRMSGTQPRLALCRHADRIPSGPEGALHRRTTLVTLDLLTGQEHARVALPGAVIHSDRRGTDLVHATRSDDGRLHAVRWDPWTGDVPWEFRSSSAVFGLGAGSLKRSATTMTVSGPGGTVTVSLDDGRQVAEPGAGVPTESLLSQALPDGGQARVLWDGDDSTLTTQIVSADGATRFSLDGAFLLPGVLEPRTPCTVAASAEGDVRCLDLADGQETWRLAGAGQLGMPLLQLGGVAVLSDGQTATALDTRDGEVLWSQRLSGWIMVEPLTDGRAVLLPVTGGGGPALAAFDLRDGTELWRTDAPPGVQRVWSPGGLLLVESSRGLSGLGPRTG